MLLSVFLEMYPQPPPAHRPTNYWIALVGLVVFMLFALLIGLREMRSRFNPSGTNAVALAEP
ncbi:MAG: hypothetical protein JOZ39_08075, partial [Chloroflexi bacterium]|nr:hypothetical protein [Chloroflexota bacterium]